MNTENRYADCRGILHNLALNFSQNSFFTYEDLVSEGNEVFISCDKNYDEKKGVKFYSWFYFCLQGHYQNIIRIKKNTIYRLKKHKVYIDIFLELKETDHEEGKDSYSTLEIVPHHYDNSEYKIGIINNFEKLSNEAKEIINIVLNGSNEIIKPLVSTKKKQFQKRKIEKYTRNKFGRKKGNQALKEIKNFVDTFQELN